MLKALRGLTDTAGATRYRRVDLSALTAQILAHEQSYLRTMNEIALQYERESIARQNLRDRLYVGLIICLLGVLLLQGFVVLRPALERIEHGIGALEQTSRALHRQVSFKELLQSVAVAANEATSIEAAHAVRAGSNLRAHRLAGGPRVLLHARLGQGADLQLAVAHRKRGAVRRAVRRDPEHPLVQRHGRAGPRGQERQACLDSATCCWKANFHAGPRPTSMCAAPLVSQCWCRVKWSRCWNSSRTRSRSRMRSC